MARANLAAMLERLDPEPAVATVEGTPTEESLPAPATSTEARSSTPSSDTRADRGSATARAGGYLSFERKETRLRADQYARLTQEARRLNKAKGTGGERITENTLIRVAIDLLFERMDDLAGATEAQLRDSVTS